MRSVVYAEQARWGCESLRVTRLGLNGPGLLLYLRDSHPHRARSLGRSAGLLGALPRMRCLGLARRDECLRVLQERAHPRAPRRAARSVSSDRVRASAAVNASGVVGRPFP
jgi:hypothetical protein